MHELRGAANALALHAQLLAVDPVDGQGEERRRRSLVAADDGRRRLFEIAETFVRHAALPEGAPGAFDLARVTRDVVTLSRPYAVQRRVAMTLAPTITPVPVRGRRDAVWQVLVDVLLGMCDRAPHGSSVEVSTAPDEDHGNASVRVRTPQAPPDPELVEWAASAMRWAGGSLRIDGDTVIIGLPASRAMESEGSP